MKSYLLIPVLAILTFSCQVEPLEPPAAGQEETEAKLSPRSIENPPDQSGFFVTRGEEIIAILFIDYDRGLTASVGVDNAAFCDPFPNPGAFQMIPTQQVDIPNDPARLQIIQKGNAHFEVYEGVINQFICNFIQNAPLLASGTAPVMLTDNDLIIYERDDPKNRNAFGFRAKGVLSDQNGNPVEFKANYRASWDGQNNSSFKEAANIRLN